MLKKIFVAILALVVFVFPLSACSLLGQFTGNDNGEENNPDIIPIICVVTFKVDGQADIVKEVNKGSALTDIPAVPTIIGCDCSWSVTDFSNVQSDLTVTLVINVKTYTITYDLEGVDSVIIAKTSDTVQYGASFTLEQPSRPAYNFVGWKDENGEFVTDEEVFTFTKDLVLKAVWQDDGHWSDRA